jgi:predicted TIM-barrel fold metal-dependent hydrolase
MWFGRTDVASVVAAVGEDTILFETDFPHPTCLFPAPLETAARNLAPLGPTARRKILGDNAAALYRL